MEDTLKQYLLLIKGRIHTVLRTYRGAGLQPNEKCLAALAYGLSGQRKASEQLLLEVTQSEFDKFNDQEKSIYFEAQAVNLVAKNKPNEAILNLCKNALLRHEKAYFARVNLARQELKAHPQKAIEQLQILEKYYPDNDEILFMQARFLHTMKKGGDARECLGRTKDTFRKNLYITIMELLSNWVLYTLAFVLLILLVYTPVVSFFFFILASILCVGLIIYGFVKRDPLIFNFFFSYILVIVTLIVVKWVIL